MKKRNNVQLRTLIWGPAIIPCNETVVLYVQYATSEGSGASAHLEPSPFANIYCFNPRLMIVVYSHILSLVFTEISPYETKHNGSSRMGTHCLPMSHKVITQANCFVPIAHAQRE